MVISQHFKSKSEPMVAVFGNGSLSSHGRRVIESNGHQFRLVSSMASEAMGIGKSSDVLTVLGGKASCRRKFVLNVHMVDDHGRLVSRDLAIVASVAYAHDHSPVVRDEKPFLAEPPLFTTFNGVEFPAQDRPTRMVSGRASFKLAISLLSSKCENRLFCICFVPQNDAGDMTPICTPCYSKPIRSISRKRAQSCVHPPPTSPLLLLAALEPSPQVSTLRYNNHGTGRLSFESDGTLGASPTSSCDNHGVNERSPTHGGNVQGSSCSSSITSMHYLSPTCITGVQDIVDEGARSESGEAVRLYESPVSANSTAGTVRSMSTTTGGELQKLNEIDPTGGMASVSCSPLYYNVPKNDSSKDKVNPTCSLSLRLSSSDSGSPTSGVLTSDSHIANKKRDRTPCVKSSPLTTRTSRTAFNAPSFLPSNVGGTRPFRPYASVGPCKLSFGSDFQLGNNISLTPSSTQPFKPADDLGGRGQASPNTLLDGGHNLRAVSPVGRHQENGKVDSVLRSFSLGTEVRSISNDETFNSALEEISLEEEEKSLQYIEVNLQEVSREVQRRKEELRSKRRRLLEDEARMHSIIFQSSSWIESLSGRFS